VGGNGGGASPRLPSLRPTLVTDGPSTTSNSFPRLLQSKHNLEIGTPFDSNSSYQTHPNNIIELEANSFSFWIWNFGPIQFHTPILCNQTLFLFPFDYFMFSFVLLEI
jgi:hypothetical protein